MRAFFIVLLIFYSFQSAFTEEYISYPKEYVLVIDHTKSIDSQNADKMRARIITRLLEDMLKLQRVVRVENPEPIYRSTVEPLTEPNPRPEDNIFALSIQTSKLSADETPRRNFFYLSSELKGSVLSIELRQGSKLLLKHKDSIDTDLIHESLEPFIEKTRRKLSPENAATLEVSSTPDRISIYIDDIFIAKTPCTAKFLAPGRYKISMRKDGFLEKTRYLELKPNEVKKLAASLTEPQGSSELQVETNPPGARVYIGPRYAGNTPLTLKKLPEASLKVRVSMQGYLDQTRQISTIAGESLQLKFALKEGDIFKIKESAKYVLPGITYLDASWGSMFLGGAFFGGNLYFLLEHDRHKESIQLGTTSAAAGQSAADSAQLKANILLAAAGTSVIFSAWFYLMHLDSEGEGFSYFSGRAWQLQPYHSASLTGFSWSMQF